ncbi:hypothetical protein D0869_08148 [Hortaea werneckii]|uniref:Apple domain-containing protein n=1 Tax=Hortaea werneckii TaxID=91943 RepID=A0A3M6WM85_HORWE|nr:hypothetical protein KC324_g2851 [Hortaea werneckii]KAI7586969.1 hypothetical protein KC316_g5305 [Hortaea werneckii]RMX79654.1 hypothetical protein D0869_08148 [Hortaea werneckii]
MTRQTFIVAALCLTLTSVFVDARAARQVQVRNANAKSNAGAASWLRNLKALLAPRQESNVCYEDEYYTFLLNSTIGESFCQSLLDYPNTTITVDYTPTSTFYDEYTTFVSTQTQIVRETPISTVKATVTIGGGAKVRRQPEITARAKLSGDEVSDFIAMFRRQASDVPASGSGDMSASFISACSCQTYGGPTVTETYTNQLTVVTISGFARTTTTETTTRTAGPDTTTVTTSVNGTAASLPLDTASASGSSPSSAQSSEQAAGSSGTTVATTSTSGASPTPTAPIYSCPEADNTTISYLVGAERFDYLILCDTDIDEDTFYGSLYYSSFAQCIGACSTTDNNFNAPVCQGVSYFNAPNENGYNCFMKVAGNETVPSVGTDSAILQRIVIGVSEDNEAGTTTEAGPFATETPESSPEEMSSMVSSIMGNSTSSMPMITPGPNMQPSGHLVNVGPYTSYSTYVSNGSTYSSGTAFSTRYTSNGVWYESYYTTYTLAWASATTEYAYGAQGTAVSSVNQTTSEVSTGDDGGWTIVTTQTSTTNTETGVEGQTVIETIGYAPNGTQTSSSATTSYFSYETAGGNAGGASGDASGGASGILSVPANASATATPTGSYFSTQTIIYGSGGSAGGSGYLASGYVSGTGGSPYTSATTIVNTYGTAFGSGYVASGQVGGSAGSSGYVASGSAPTPVVSSTVIVNTYGTAGGSGYVASGSAPTPIVSSSVIVNTYGTAASSGYLASGSIGGTAGESSTILSGSAPTGPSYGFSAPTAPRGSGYSSTIPGTAPLGTAPLGTGPASYGTSGESSTIFSSPVPSGYIPSSGSPPASVPTFNSESGGYVPPTGSVTSVPSVNMTSYGFPAPSGPRSPASESTPSMTPVLSTNETVPIPTGTAPPSYGFSAPSGPRSSFPAISTNGTVLTPTAYMTYTPPVVTGPSPYPSPNTSTLPSYGFSAPSGPRSPFPEGTAASSGSPLPSYNTSMVYPTASGSPSFSFSAPSGPRSPFPSVTAPIGTGTAPTAYPPFPTSPQSCFNGTIGTTTIFSTVTEFGCYDECRTTIFGGDGYGGPRSFGPPNFVEPPFETPTSA